MTPGGPGVWSFSFSRSVSAAAHLALLFLLSTSIKVVILPSVRLECERSGR